jgi:hypothetical protein
MFPHTRNNTINAYSAVCGIVFFALFFSIFFFPSVSNAQSFIPTGETTLALTPESPKAGKEFEARVEAYAYDITRAQINWSIDGVIREEYAGEQDITLQAPNLGVPLRIAVTVTEASGRAHTVTKTVTPGALDLVVESDTRVPHFYRGRALPSNGSTVRLIAFPSVYAQNGSAINANNLIYTWRINKNVAKAGLGQNTLRTEMPRSGPLLVEITAETGDGSVRHSSIEQIHAALPHNLFYEDNPLHGLSQNTLPPEFTLLEDEISIRAEPYFVSRDIFNNAQYTWSMGGTAIANPNADPQTLTLRKTGGSGSARIAFSIRNLESLLQAASSAFTVYFEN